MNTYFDYLAVAFLFLFPSLVVVIFGRALRGLAMTSVHVYHWYASEFSDGRWEKLCTAQTLKQGLSWRRPYLWFMPRWFLSDQSKSLPIVSYKDFDEAEDYWEERWSIGDKPYLLVRKPDHSVRNVLLALDILLIVLLAGALWLNFHPGAFSAQPTPTVAPTAEYATPRPTPTGPTMEPLSTTTPEVEVTEGGESIVINLDQQAPGDALLEWINGLKGPDLPALPTALEDWLNSLPWPEVAAIELPEGMDGFVVVARRGDGFELVRLDESGNLIGSPVALEEVNGLTLHARDLKWGVRYSDKFRVTDESQGHIDVYVAESGEPTMATGYHLYNFRWWHVAVLIVLIIIGIVAYRKLNY